LVVSARGEHDVPVRLSRKIAVALGCAPRAGPWRCRTGGWSLGPGPGASQHPPRASLTSDNKEFDQVTSNDEDTKTTEPRAQPMAMAAGARKAAPKKKAAAKKKAAPKKAAAPKKKAAPKKAAAKKAAAPKKKAAPKKAAAKKAAAPKKKAAATRKAAPRKKAAAAG
jgi:hypothetical protein